MRKLTDSQLADLLAMLGIIDKHFADTNFHAYSYQLSKMAWSAGEMVRHDFIANAIELLVLKYNVRMTTERLSESLYQCSINDTLVITDPDLSRAKIEAGALYLEGKVLPCTPTS